MTSTTQTTWTPEYDAARAKLRNSIFTIYEFRQAQQNADESLHALYARLRQLSRPCNLDNVDAETCLNEEDCSSMLNGTCPKWKSTPIETEWCSQYARMDSRAITKETDERCHEKPMNLNDLVSHQQIVAAAAVVASSMRTIKLSCMAQDIQSM
ncbi:hypothetical protein HPB52_002768 [Rhipicephalus sanguineus]|uniref:Uncharacterized protein n=1 Tax=Rhipicephalus sanguineus TaxID=34632 RepID=A0A9D4QHA3_RHISA|nr:hypothetical protein HPB52_002768 [Rhipicephalus sanguineus]